MLNFVVEEGITERIDKYLSKVSKISRVEIQELIKIDQILLNSKVVNLNKSIVKEGDKIEILSRINRDITITPENIPLNIVYEDESLLIINKANHMVTHPAPGNYSGTLVNALIYHFNTLSDINGDTRPGIVHRLDKGTTGLLVIAKNNDVHNYLSDLLQKHEIKREYLAITEGILPNKITHVDLPIGRDKKNRKQMTVKSVNSKKAITHLYVEKIFPRNTLVRCILETGRTHQIRVHLEYIKHPVLSDEKYGKAIDDFGPYLHAEKLSFIHPNGKKNVFLCSIT